MVGPLRHFEMARFDAKHRPFKIFRNITNNLKDLNKSLAQKHQKKLCNNGFTYNDNIQHGVLKPFDDVDDNILYLLRNHDVPAKDVYRTKFVRYNNYRYSKDLFIVHNQSFYEIVDILYINENLYFLCLPYVIEEFDVFFNSFKLKKIDSSSLSIVKFSELTYPKSYESKRVGMTLYIISDSLNLRNNLNN